MDKQKQDNHLKLTYSSSVPIRDVTLKTCRKQWIIERGGVKGSGISVLIVQHDDNADDETGCHIKVKEPSMAFNSSIAEEEIVGFIPFPKDFKAM